MNTLLCVLAPLFLANAPVGAAPSGAQTAEATPAAAAGASVASVAPANAAPANAAPSATSAKADGPGPEEISQVMLWSGVRKCGVVMKEDQREVLLRDARGNTSSIRRAEIAQLLRGPRARACLAQYSSQGGEASKRGSADEVLADSTHGEEEPGGERSQVAVHVGYPWGLPEWRSTVMSVSAGGSPARAQLGLIGNSLVVGRAGLSPFSPRLAPGGRWTFDLPLLVGVGLIDGKPETFDLSAQLDATYWLSRSVGASVRATVGRMYALEAEEWLSFSSDREDDDDQPVYFQLSIGVALR